MSLRALSIASTLALAAAVVGCGGGERAPKRQVFADAAAPIFSAAVLDGEREIAAGELGDRWRVEGAALDVSDLGWILGVDDADSGQARVASLSGAVDFEAELVDVVDLQVEAAPPLGRVELRWISRRAGREGRGSLDLELSLVMGDRLRSSVARHPEWRGRIRQLEWRFSPIPDGQRLRVRGWRALDLEPSSQALAQALGTSWRVDLGRDVRPSILALPGLERAIDIRVPEDGRFRVALGATAPRLETAYVVRLRDRDDVHELLRRTVDRDGSLAWSDVELDLSAWAGRDVTLELSVEAEAWQPGDGLPVWGGPELLHRSEPERPDLILISADTLRADHLSLYGYPRPTSPVIDRWARERAVIFRRAMAPSPWTLPSHVSMFSGLDPLSHGANYGLPAPSRLALLAEQLREAGYATYADTGGGYLHPAYGLARGFDVFRYPASQVPEEGDLGRAVERAIAFADAQPGPVFVFLHSYETHEPFTARVGALERLGLGSSPGVGSTWVTQWVPPVASEGYAHRRRFIDAASGSPAPGRSATLLRKAPGHQGVIDLYDGRVAHLDAQLAPLFEWTERRTRKTATLFTSDHGESLGEDGRGGHASLEPQVLHIPMLLALPDGHGAGVEVESRVRLYDVTPTLLEIAGVAPSPSVDGESLLGRLQPAAASLEAWAASPSTNAGVAAELVETGGERLRVQPAAWAPAGLARLESEAPQPPESALRRVVRRLEETASGLEILVVADGEPWDLQLRGSVVQNHRVKGLDLSPRAVEWLGQV
ncbi:MAG: sulfatase, partial [Acidobacteriota bacterium]